jgi:hypothetical protein
MKSGTSAVNLTASEVHTAWKNKDLTLLMALTGDGELQLNGNLRASGYLLEPTGLGYFDRRVQFDSLVVGPVGNPIIDSIAHSTTSGKDSLIIKFGGSATVYAIPMFARP